MSSPRLPDSGSLERTVLAPLIATVAAAAVGFGIAKACCGFKLGRLDPHGFLPLAMAGLTSGVALFTYLYPQPEAVRKGGKTLAKTVRQTVSRG